MPQLAKLGIRLIPGLGPGTQVELSGHPQAAHACVRQPGSAKHRNRGKQGLTKGAQGSVLQAPWVYFFSGRREHSGTEEQ